MQVCRNDGHVWLTDSRSGGQGWHREGPSKRGRTVNVWRSSPLGLKRPTSITSASW